MKVTNMMEDGQINTLRRTKNIHIPFYWILMHFIFLFLFTVLLFFCYYYFHIKHIFITQYYEDLIQCFHE